MSPEGPMYGAATSALPRPQECESAAVPIPTLRLLRRRRTGAGWDGFAQRCEATFLGSQGCLRALRGTHRVRLFDLHDGADKIGQCAVAQARLGASRTWIFCDSLMLLPGETQHWPAAMRLILQALGAGRYRYGSGWSTAPSREAALRGCGGVRVISSEVCAAQAVPFVAWQDWPSFRRTLSSNARRNAAKALLHDPAMQIERVLGWRALRHAPLLYRMQRAMHQRKGTDFGWTDSLQFLRRLVLLQRYVVLDLVKYRNQYTGFALSLGFGAHTYYVHGASTADNAGSAWYLLIELLHATQRAQASGKLVMGYDQPEQRQRWSGWEKVLRQRQQCQAVDFPTAIVTFDWQPGVL